MRDKSLVKTYIRNKLSRVGAAVAYAESAAAYAESAAAYAESAAAYADAPAGYADAAAAYADVDVEAKEDEKPEKTNPSTSASSTIPGLTEDAKKKAIKAAQRKKNKSAEKERKRKKKDEKLGKK